MAQGSSPIFCLSFNSINDFCEKRQKQAEMLPVLQGARMAPLFPVWFGPLLGEDRSDRAANFWEKS